MQPPGIFTDKAWHSQCKNCLTSPPVPAEEQGLPGTQPSFPTPPWEGKLPLQLCHKGGLVNHTSINSVLWAVPDRLSLHPTKLWATAELIKVWNGITVTHTHTQSFRQQRLKQVFLVILHPTQSSSETEPSNALWLTSRAEYIAEFSLLKKKKNHNSSTLFYKPCTNKRQFSPCLQNYVTRAWYFTQEFRKENNQNNKTTPTTHMVKAQLTGENLEKKNTVLLPKNSSHCRARASNSAGSSRQLSGNTHTKYTLI